MEYVINPSLLPRLHPVATFLYNPAIFLHIHFFVNFCQINSSTTMKRLRSSILLCIFVNTVLVVSKVRNQIHLSIQNHCYFNEFFPNILLSNYPNYLNDKIKHFLTVLKLIEFLGQEQYLVAQISKKLFQQC